MPKNLSILRVFFASALFSGIALAQTTLMPMPRQCFQDVLQSGKPLAGGKIFTYQAGTSTPQATFTDATGLIANSNPVILDAAGCWTIWLTSGQAYKFVAQNSVGVTEWTTDQVSGLATSSSAFNQAITTVTFSATPTFAATGQYQVFKMTLTGNVTSSTLSMTGVTVPSLVTFELSQDATGGRTFTWPLNTQGGTAINPTALAVTNVTFFWDGTTAWVVDSYVSKTFLTPTITTPTITNPTINSTAINFEPWQLLTRTTVPATHTGDVTTDTIYTTALPVLAANSTVRVTVGLSSTVQGAGSTTVIITLGATTVGTVSVSSTGSCILQATISNQNSVSVQVSSGFASCSTTIAAANSNAAINTGVSATLAVKATNANNSDSQTFGQYLVEYAP